VARPEDLPGAAEVAVSTTDILWHSLREGWKYRAFDKTLSRAEVKQYGDRVKYEMDAILGKDFGDYFAVLGDVVRAAKDQGRGVPGVLPPAHHRGQPDAVPAHAVRAVHRPEPR
jgi:DNA polymerase III alpha subunit